MLDSQLAAFIGLTFLLAVTPGVSTAVVVSNVLARGRGAGYAAAGGAAAANAMWATGSAFGLSAMVDRAPVMLDVIRVAGALFLVWLAAKRIISAWMGATVSNLRNSDAATHDRPFVEGLLANLLHPSVAAYYLSVVPSFLTSGPILQPRFALLASIHIAMAFACHIAWGTSFNAFGAFWNRPRVQRGVNVAIGAALLLLAASLFT